MIVQEYVHIDVHEKCQSVLSEAKPWHSYKTNTSVSIEHLIRVLHEEGYLDNPDYKKEHKAWEKYRRNSFVRRWEAPRPGKGHTRFFLHGQMQNQRQTLHAIAEPGEEGVPGLIKISPLKKKIYRYFT